MTAAAQLASSTLGNVDVTMLKASRMAEAHLACPTLGEDNGTVQTASLEAAAQPASLTLGKDAESKSGGSGNSSACFSDTRWEDSTVQKANQVAAAAQLACPTPC